MALSLLYSPRSRVSPRTVDTRLLKSTQNETEIQSGTTEFLSDPIHPARCSMGATFPYAIAPRINGAAGIGCTARGDITCNPRT